MEVQSRVPRTPEASARPATARTIAPESSLHRARGEQQADPSGRGAGEARQREEAEAGERDAMPVASLNEPRRRDRRRAERERVDGQHRGDAVDRRVEVDEELRQRERDDRRVREDQTCRERERTARVAALHERGDCVSRAPSPDGAGTTC